MEKMFRSGAKVYFVGIKGSGMCALAELMHGTGIKISGSDTQEVFYTDAILKKLGIPYHKGFDARRISGDFDGVIHSAAYDMAHPELAQARKIGLPLASYPQALGAWSARFDSAGVAGVHGKTTVTALSGAIMGAARLPVQVLVGSAVADFGGRCTLSLGGKYFVAETCEYKKHFLLFSAKNIILTAVESDHQDFFPDYKSIRDAFLEYCLLLPSGGRLIYCADDPGASEVASAAKKEKPQIKIVPYGFSAGGGYGITRYAAQGGLGHFALRGFPGDFKMQIPGRHSAQNAAAALALTMTLLETEAEAGGAGGGDEKLEAVKKALENFKGSKRRSEIIGRAGGIVFMDDYGHHPSAIKTTLAGIKSFYPQSRLVASFMSHTYTRTAALFDEFAEAFDSADIVFFHKIYASARETYNGGINGEALYKRVLSGKAGKEVFYTSEPLDAFEPLTEVLRPGDIFITMGAGNNWPLGEKLLRHYAEKETASQAEKGSAL